MNETHLEVASDPTKPEPKLWRFVDAYRSENGVINSSTGERSQLGPQSEPKTEPQTRN